MENCRVFLHLKATILKIKQIFKITQIIKIMQILDYEPFHNRE